jgi:adenylate cyclase
MPTFKPFSRPMHRLHWRKIRTVLFYWIMWLAASWFFVFFRFFPAFETHLSLPVSLQTLIYGSAMGVSNGIYEAYIIQENRNNRPILLTLTSRLLYYSWMYFFVAILFALLSIDTLDYSMLHTWVEIIHHPEFLPLYLFTVIASFGSHFVRTVDKKFGHRSLLNTLLGKQQEPTEEQRIFLYLDLKGATTLAEKLGPHKYSSFLRDYFFLVSNVCAENYGEIYQYAGDGVIISWPLDRCRKQSHCLRFYFDLKLAFAGMEARFKKRYGVIPHFKAAAHCGIVISTEVGNYGSEMAFHGDTVNTTARIQSLCNLLKKDFLISEMLLFKLPRKHEYKFIECGSFELKGKNREVDILSVEYLHAPAHTYKHAEEL